MLGGISGEFTVNPSESTVNLVGGFEVAIIKNA